MGILDSVGKIYRWDPLTKKSTDPKQVSANFVVGRDKNKCHYVFDDIYVSGRHLLIYTIIYDKENPLEIPPLVYAQDLSTNGTFWNGQEISKKNGGVVLLSDGDILRLSPTCFLEFRAGYQSEKQLSLIQKDESKGFANEYLISDRLLGEGSFGQVRMAINSNTGSQVACKVVNLQSMRKHGEMSRHSKLLELQKQEVLILKKLCHPNIIGVEKVITTENSVYIFEDLITGGDLFTFIESKHGFVEDFEAAFIIQQILIALSYLHDNSIVHRDLKPENILMASRGDYSRILLADFGCAQTLSSPTERMYTIVGTWDFTAPEVYIAADTRGYTKAVDLWSVGCIAFVLLLGEPPFLLADIYDVESIDTGELQDMFETSRWNNASTLAQEFIKSLLVMDEDKRLTAQEALNHPWFTNSEYNTELKKKYEAATRDWQLPQKNEAAGPSGDDSETALAPTEQKIPESENTESTSSYQLIIKPMDVKKYITIKPSDHGLPTPEPGIRDNTSASIISTPRSCRRSFSPQAWKTILSDNPILLSPRSPIIPCEEPPDMAVVRWPKVPMKPGLWLYALKELNDNSDVLKDIASSVFSNYPALLNEKPSEDASSQSSSSPSSSSEESEVYEEIENKITGKVQRILYRER